MATTWLATHDVVTEYSDLFDDELKFCNVLPFVSLVEPLGNKIHEIRSPAGNI